MADACKICNTNAEKSNIDGGTALKDALEQLESFQETVTECAEESGTPLTSDDDDEERKALAADIMAAVAAVDSSDDSDDDYSDDDYGNDGEENESSPDEEGDEHDEIKLHRVKRWDHHGRRKHSNSRGRHYGKKDKKDKKRKHYKTTEVTFGFSRNKYSLTNPKWKYGFKCGDKTQKLDLTKYRHGQWKKEYTIVAQEMQHSIVHHKGCATSAGCYKRFKIKKIYKLNNKCLWTAFKYEQSNIFAENRKKFSNTRMLWHGSKNIDDIVNEGMNEGWANMNGMFGAGLYFAEHASKSNQYLWGEFNKEGCPVHKNPACTICERKLLLCRVVLGRSQEVYSKQVGKIHPKPGYHSLVAKPKKGVLNFAEYIVYKGSQVYPEYLVVYTI